MTATIVAQFRGRPTSVPPMKNALFRALPCGHACGVFRLLGSATRGAIAAVCRWRRCRACGSVATMLRAGVMGKLGTRRTRRTLERHLERRALIAFSTFATTIKAVTTRCEFATRRSSTITPRRTRLAIATIKRRTISAKARRGTVVVEARSSAIITRCE